MILTLFSVKRGKAVKGGNYRKLILSIVTSLVGLGCNEFKDSVCFLLRLKNNPDEAKSKSEFLFKSLLQLLSTTDDRTFENHFLPSPGMNTPWFFELDATNAEIDRDIDKDALIKYAAYIEAGKEIIGDLHKSKDGRVTYKEYESNTHSPQDTDSHKPLNDKLSELRSEKVGSFLEIRKVPFFLERELATGVGIIEY